MSKLKKRIDAGLEKLDEYIRLQSVNAPLTLSGMEGILEAMKEPETIKDRGNISDGYHTFNELYDHRCLLWINYCLTNIDRTYLVENHFDGWFLLGKETRQGQISYHCPNKFLSLVKTIERRHPEFDGHTSNIVLVRLKDLAISEPDIIKNTEQQPELEAMKEPEDNITHTYSTNPFQFLNNKEEDVYTLKDGEPINPTEQEKTEQPFKPGQAVLLSDKQFEELKNSYYKPRKEPSLEEIMSFLINYEKVLKNNDVSAYEFERENLAKKILALFKGEN